MKDSLQTIIYATVLGVVCASLLTGAAVFTAPYKKINAQAEEYRGKLSVLEVPFPSDASSDELVKIYDQNIHEDPCGAVALYEYRIDGRIEAVAIEFKGSGLWGPIKGFLALEPDMKTIRGIIFTEQEETPGLGGDIVTEGFRGRFKGKQIVDASGIGGIRIVRDGSAAVNGVDSITGATITCTKVQDMLNKAIEQLMKER